LRPDLYTTPGFYLRFYGTCILVLASVKISGTHWKCIENFLAIISICTANCILTYGGGVWGGGLPPSPVKKTLNKWASVNISGTNGKSIGNSRAMHFQCVPLIFMCPLVLYNDSNYAYSHINSL